jgi:hypothetical protein
MYPNMLNNLFLRSPITPPNRKPLHEEGKNYDENGVLQDSDKYEFEYEYDENGIEVKCSDDVRVEKSQPV